MFSPSLKKLTFFINFSDEKIFSKNFQVEIPKFRKFSSKAKKTIETPSG